MLFRSSLPALKHISLWYFQGPFDGSPFPNCRVLESVEMFDYRNLSSQFLGTNFRHVTTLEFSVTSIWDEFDLDALSLFPALHDLTLFTCHWGKELLSVSSHLPIIFERLHILRAHGNSPPQLLTKLVAPALEELHVKADHNSMTSIHSLQTSFNPLCKHIHAFLPNAVSAREPKWAIDLSRLVQKCTRIRSLYISQWMEEECKTFLSGQDVVLHVQYGD